ncbi:hypothetical protein HHK36_014507 [Tetracentron sinense]|uniref:CDT1 Geminin-binding domain-containing protein n=1 Tax=Tetracentron sinense TaxID=13715 RepID=A0A834Z2R8_TETSI|nr:hypothetical protein HHK36_014507 [Tetracentron sinense]
MEQIREESMQNVLDFECKSQDSVNEFASLTPLKTTEPLWSKNKEEAVKLLDQYKNIAEFFDRMNSSLRLLTLCKKLPTFQNICTQVEILTKRKFSYNHLAQIKYILPEVVQIEKILMHDKKTLCMKEDMKITLVFDVVEACPDQSAFMGLREVFRARLLDFFNTHPEGCDIPEAMLPDPFNQRSHMPEPLPMESSIKFQPTSIEHELLSDPSHLSPSFSRRFSKKTIVPETEKTKLLASPVPLLYVNSSNETSQDTQSPQQKEFSYLLSKSTNIKSPAELIFSPKSSINSIARESPPLKLDLISDNMMVETPAQLTPKRLIPISDDMRNTHTTETGKPCHISAKRSLVFSHLEGDESDLDTTVGEANKCSAVHNTSLQTVATKSVLDEEDVNRAPSVVLQKVEENKLRIVKDCKMSQQMLASLPDLLNLIHRVFQSAKCSSITKHELMHKIISNNCDIVDRREVEEQLELLEELVPDWICRKLLPSGDLFYSIKEVPDLELVRSKLTSHVNRL